MSDLRRDALGLFANGIIARSRLSDEEREAILDLPGEIAHVRTNQDLVRLGEAFGELMGAGANVDNAEFIEKGVSEAGADELV